MEFNTWAPGPELSVRGTRELGIKVKGNGHSGREGGTVEQWLPLPADSITYTRTTCSTAAMPMPQSSAANAMDNSSSPTWQTLIWNRPPWIEPDAPQHFGVLFEDPHLLAVNKPSGLPTLPAGGFLENTLLRLVQEQIPNANPVHRLGRATSGIVLFAKTPQAACNLFANWNTPKTRKIYRALAQNIAQHNAYEILTPIGLVPHPLIGSVWAADPGGKPSKSLATVISRASATTTFEVGLNSGRPHQIRIHLASIGHPLAGDPLYGLTGRPLDKLPGLPGDGGYFLHAQYLKFHHPITGEPINLEAAVPSGFSLDQ